MKTFEEFRMDRLTTAQAGTALMLSKEADWNQTEGDWRFLISQGNARGLFTDQNELIATAATLPFGDSFAWISLVLVTRRWRNRGLAAELVKSCLAELEAQGVVPILDATEAGLKVYQRLGFNQLYHLSRWQASGEKYRENGGQETQPEEVQLMSGSDLEEVCAWDAERFGNDRGFVLRELYQRSSDFSCVSLDLKGNLQGYLLGRDGRMAKQIGPVVAREKEVVQRLIAFALARLTGHIFIDVPLQCREFCKWLTSRGFNQQRDFVRMAKGRKKPFGRPKEIFATAGPEFG